MSKREHSGMDESEEVDVDSDCDSDDFIENPDWDSSRSINESDGMEDEFPEQYLEVVLNEMNMEEDIEFENQREFPEGDTKIDWQEYQRRHKTFVFTGKSGLQKEFATDIMPVEAFLTFIDDEVISLIVAETNKYAYKRISGMRYSQHARVSQWKETDENEIKKFLGLLLWMGLVKMDSIPSYWSTKPLYKNQVAAEAMSRNRFELLLRFINFSDGNEILPDDSLGKIQPFLGLLQQKFKENLYPGEDFVIDETFVPWNGKLIFRQYIPLKTHNYGIKLFKLCSTEGYTWALNVCSGTSSNGSLQNDIAKNVCEQLAEGLLYQGRTLYIGNFYTSYDLALSFLLKQTHVVGMVRPNRSTLPQDVLDAELNQNGMAAREDKNGIVFLKWRDTRDRMISTKHVPVILTNSVIDKCSTSSTNSQTTARNRIKPLALLDCNRAKAGIEVSNQLGSYAMTLRKGVKWYRKLAVELILGVAVVNAFVLFKKAIKCEKLKFQSFKEDVAAALLNISNTGERTRPKCENIHVLAIKSDKNNKTIRRACVLCYADMKKTEGRIQARKKAKKVTTYCQSCENAPYMCLQCFARYHKS